MYMYQEEEEIRPEDHTQYQARIRRTCMQNSCA